MDGLGLLAEAVAAGLTVRVDGDRLVIRGPKTADTVARRLLEHKPDVVAALRGESPSPRPTPDPTAAGSPAATGSPEAPADAPTPDPDVVEIPAAFVQPCPSCGSLVLWWDVRGGVHCMTCEGKRFERGLRLVQRARRLREQADRQNPKPQEAQP